MKQVVIPSVGNFQIKKSKHMNGLPRLQLISENGESVDVTTDSFSLNVYKKIPTNHVVIQDTLGGILVTALFQSRVIDREPLIKDVQLLDGSGSIHRLLI